MALSPVFDETYRGYLKQLEGFDLGSRQAILGIEVHNDGAIIPYYNKRYFVSTRGVVDEAGKVPQLSVCVVLCKYLLMCPEELPATGELATFKDFKDAAPLIHFFDKSIQGEVARRFSGSLHALEAACRRMGGAPHDGDWVYQLKYQFSALPRIPIYLLFNDAEEGFAAQCTMLFERRTEYFLDMESVAMLAGSLSALLQSKAKNA